MKISKSLLACMMVAGFAAAASAQTEVYICGSTAYRGAVTKAIQDVLWNGVTPHAFSFAKDGGSSGKSVYGAGAAIFSGTYGGNWTIVHTYWTGSLAGCVDTANANALPFMPDTVAMAPAVAPTNGTNAYGGGVDDYNTYTATSVAPNIGMSDSFNTSVEKSLVGISPTLAAPIGNLIQAGKTAYNEKVVGVLPFEWVAGATTTGSAPFSNISQEAASQLIQQGYVPITSLATSSSDPVSGDTNDYAFLIGRNEDSGTRICAQAESQVGSAFGAQSFGRSMVQYYAEFTGSPKTDGAFGSTGNGTLNSAPIQTGGGSVQVSDIGVWPAFSPLSTEPSIDWDTYGHSGQIGGGDVAAVLSAANPMYLNLTAIDNADGYATAGYSSAPSNWDPAGNGNSTDQSNKAYLVGYIGIADATGIAPTVGTARVLTYNGVSYSPAAIQNGSYDFWSFEHMYYLSTAPSLVRTFADYLNKTLYTGDCQTDGSGNTDSSTVPNAAVAGLEVPNVHFTKTQEGAVISPNY